MISDLPWVAIIFLFNQEHSDKAGKAWSKDGQAQRVFKKIFEGKEMKLNKRRYKPQRWTGQLRGNDLAHLNELIAWCQAEIDKTTAICNLGYAGNPWCRSAMKTFLKFLKEQEALASPPRVLPASNKLTKTEEDEIVLDAAKKLKDSDGWVVLKDIYTEVLDKFAKYLKHPKSGVLRTTQRLRDRGILERFDVNGTPPKGRGHYHLVKQYR